MDSCNLKQNKGVKPLANNPSYREINLGNLNGLSSYELAVKNGTFSGTEQDYVKKEQKTYDDMVAYIENFKKQLGLINTEAMKRLYDVGDVADMIVDNIYGAMVNSGVITSGESFSYTCRNDNAIIFGMEQSTMFGVQLKIGWNCGVLFRSKNDSPTWSSWRQCIGVETESSQEV